MTVEPAARARTRGRPSKITAGAAHRGLALGALLALLASNAAGDPARSLGATEFVLENGMRFVVVTRPGAPTVEAGWVVDVGSADEPPGATGRSHLLEHMLFKGSTTIGARDSERERALLAKIDALDLELRSGGSGSSGRASPRRTKRLELRDRLEAEAATLAELGAFSLEYSRQGGTRVNANTAEDLTLYYATLPAERLELWFWLESDRLRDPVFRELPKEKRIVAEERRTRIESTPTGAADAEVAAAFWRGTPYGRPTLGDPADVAGATRSDLRRFFRSHYGPERLTAVLVGAVEPDAARSLAERYFGRLESGGTAAVRSPTVPERGEETKLSIECPCPEQVRILYPTVSFGHSDQHALQGLAGLLNGRAGRLHRRLVLEERVAFAAFARQKPARRAGSFEVTLESRGGHSTDELVAGWDRVLAALVAESPTEEEWTRSRRRLATDHLDALKDPHSLMRRLLVYAGLGDWRGLLDWSDRMAQVEAAELSIAARRYLVRDRRLVAHYRERPGGSR